MRPVPEAPFAFVMSFLFASLVIRSSVVLLVVLVCRLSLSLVCAREEGLCGSGDHGVSGALARRCVVVTLSGVGFYGLSQSSSKLFSVLASGLL